MNLTDNLLAYSRFRLILNSTNKPVEAELTEVNQGFEFYFQSPRERLIRKSLFEIFDISDDKQKEQWLDDFYKVAYCNDHFERELYFDSLDTTFKVSVSSPIEGEVITVLNEIQKDRVCNGLLSDILNNIPEAMFTMNSTGSIDFVNEHMSTLTGYSSEELMGKSMCSIVIKDSGDVEERFSKLRVNEVLTFESEQIAKNGTLIPVEVKLKVLVVDDEKKYFVIVRDITNYKDDERVFRTLFEQVPYGIALAASGGRSYLVNKALENILGYTAEEIYNMSFKDFTYPEDFDLNNVYYQDLLDGKIDNYSLEKRYVKKDGTIVPASLKVWKIKDPNTLSGKRIIAMVENLSEIKKNQQELEKFNRFFNLCYDNFLISDADGLIVDHNPKFEKTIGHSKKEIKGKKFLSFVHPEDLCKTLVEIRRLEGSKNTVNFRNRYKTKSGVYKHLEWVVVSNNSMYYAVARDITDTVMNQRRADEVESVYLAMQEAAPYPIILLDAKGEIKFVNKQTLQLWGYDSLSELEGKLITEFDDYFTSEGVKSVISKMKSGKLIEFVTSHKLKDGTKIPVEMRVIYLSIGKEELFYGMARDLTKDQEQEKKLQVKNELLNRSQKIAKLGSWHLNAVKNDFICSDEIYRILDIEPQYFDRTLDGFFSFVHPQEQIDLKEYFEYCVEKRVPYKITHRIMTNSNMVKYVEENATFEFDNEQGLIYVNGTMQDVTEKVLYQDELKIKNHNLNRFFENAHIGIVKNDLEGKFLEVNPEFLRITEYSLEELREMTNWDLTPMEFYSEEKKQLKNLLTEGKYGSYKKELITKTRHRVPVLINGVKTKDANGSEFIWSVIQDVTEEENYKDQLRQDIKKLQALLQLGKLLAFEIDLETDKIITIYNESDAKFFDKFKGLAELFYCIKEEHRILFSGTLQVIIDGGSYSQNEIQVNNGTRYNWYKVVLSRLDSRHSQNNLPRIFVTLRNIQSEKNTEYERLLSQEKERIRIARDVHDSIGQMLVATRLTLRTQVPKEVRSNYLEVDELLEEMVNESRLIINNFGEGLSSSSSLEEAFYSMAEKMNRVYPGEIKIHWKGNSEIEDLTKATHVFRIYQEALSNAIKYSSSSQIRINVRNVNHFFMDIIDNGVGYDTKTVAPGYGRINMIERSREINLDLKIESEIGKGTAIRLRPLR
ncbi:PAS domain-containing sensor histidine kinase [Reichenbachiella versicolor]|uniref:PAS domain-containing sensor histidine kinase n=1 Tax=Reichenbachiella versicolor TaxID=1821036 RepID=UPI000D6DE7D9|nr:PAS domain S-box protein [Reichenbachiella versicolor]